MMYMYVCGGGVISNLCCVSTDVVVVVNVVILSPDVCTLISCLSPVASYTLKELTFLYVYNIF